LQGAEQAGVKGGVGERGVKAIALCLLALLGGQRYLCVEVFVFGEGSGQSLEGGAVVEAEVFEAGVEVF
jgi:hypothetical protein